MQRSKIQQWVVLSATIATLVLGAGFAYFQSVHDTQIWPMAVVLVLLWGTIGIWITRRADQGNDSSAKK